MRNGMKRTDRKFSRLGIALGAAAIFAFTAGSALAVDWSSVAGKEVVLFHPGQASWEWVLTQSKHSGAKKFRSGKNCKECHSGEEADMGGLLVTGEKAEPKPIDGKRGSIPVDIKFAHDGERLYVRLAWTAASGGAGDRMDPDYATKVTLILDDGGVKTSARAGCWSACHDDAAGMASDPDDGTPIKKYMSRTRVKNTRTGGGRNLKPQGDIDALRDSGQYLEYWQARLNDGSPANAADGYILAERHENETATATAEAQLVDGKWVVVLSRALQADGPFHKDIVAGKQYAVGFAIHENHTTQRFHNVSFEHSLVLDQGEADFVAVKK